MADFDYIVLGAGSAGCALASRLSEDGRYRVCLVEAGGSNQSPFIRMAGGFMKILGRSEYFWSFPVLQKDGRKAETHVYGKGLGGSSSINGTWYMQGAPQDFDSWRDQGLPGWGWDEIGKAFRSLESYTAPGAAPDRGSNGPLQITPSDYDSPVFRALIEACKGFGIPYLPDINDAGSEGVGRTQYTVDRFGRRASSYEAFIAPVRRRRPNLEVMTQCQVKRIRFEGRRATGVVCERDGEEIVLDARGEVIVSAGVYMSPAILQRSGIGPGALLTGLGVEVVHDAGSVGSNLADHQKLGISYDLNSHPGTNREFVGWRLYANALKYFMTRRGPLARVGMPMTMMWASDGNHHWPDIQIGAAPFAMKTVKEMAASPGSPISARPGITFSGYHLRPRSRGTVAIQSADWRQSPQVDTNMWADPFDQDMALVLVKALRRVAAAPALREYVGKERVPGPEIVSDPALLKELRNLVDPGLHGTGTCSMGTDAAKSVVDARCRVHGIDGLRVVDCSIMPTPVSGNTNGPAMAIGYRAAEILKADMR